jgi:hypothetical protein
MSSYNNASISAQWTVCDWRNNADIWQTAIQLFAPAEVLTDNEYRLFCWRSFSFHAPIQTLGKANTGRLTALAQIGWNLGHIEGKNVPIFFPVVFRPDSWTWPHLTGLRDRIPWTHQNWYDSSGRMINPSQRPLPDN